MYLAQSPNWDTFQIELEFRSVGFEKPRNRENSQLRLS